MLAGCGLLAECSEPRLSRIERFLRRGDLDLVPACFRCGQLVLELGDRFVQLTEEPGLAFLTVRVVLLLKELFHKLHK